MLTHIFPSWQRGAAIHAAILCALLAALLPISSLHANPAAPALTVAVELLAVEDAGMIESVPTFNGGGAPYFVLNARAGGDFD